MAPPNSELQHVRDCCKLAACSCVWVRNASARVSAHSVCSSADWELPCPRLQALDLSHNLLLNGSPHVCLSAMLRQCASCLQVLNLAHTRGAAAQHGAATALSQAFWQDLASVQLPALRMLDVSHCHLNSQDAVHLGHALRASMPRLQTLKLSGNALCEVCIAVATMLKGWLWCLSCQHCFNMLVRL